MVVPLVSLQLEVPCICKHARVFDRDRVLKAGRQVLGREKGSREGVVQGGRKLWRGQFREEGGYGGGILQQFLTALLIQFGFAASSAMTLPMTLECLQMRCHIDERVISLVCPLGASINMDGTAIYFVMVVLYLLSIRGRMLSFAQVSSTV